jgi:TPR repeat protein
VKQLYTEAGNCYRDTKADVTQKNILRAAELYEKAGNAEALRLLALEKYQKGVDVTKDQAEAVKLLQKAVDLGDVDSRYWLGKAFYAGTGTTVDNQMGARCSGRLF